MKCELCPRKCGIDRTASTGFCGQTDKIRISRAAPHMWEEPCISGTGGSGTVFFIGCTLGCVYCQNSAISRKNAAGRGIELTPAELATVFVRLQEKGVHNINLVTPTMFADKIADAVDSARDNGLRLPIVYNTSGYELTSALDIMQKRIDFYMPDFKYISEDISRRYSGCPDYPVYAKSSLAHMVKRIGEAEFDGNGMMTRGVIVRHLLLPGQLEESKRVVAYLYSEYGNSIYYSLMSQYTPTSALDKERYPELARKVTTYEYRKLIDFAANLGIRNGFVQRKGTAEESFIPEFDGMTVLQLLKEKN